MPLPRGQGPVSLLSGFSSRSIRTERHGQGHRHPVISASAFPEPSSLVLLKPSGCRRRSHYSPWAQRTCVASFDWQLPELESDCCRKDKKLANAYGGSPVAGAEIGISATLAGLPGLTPRKPGRGGFRSGSTRCAHRAWRLGHQVTIPHGRGNSGRHGLVWPALGPQLLGATRALAKRCDIPSRLRRGKHFANG